MLLLQTVMQKASIKRIRSNQSVLVIYLGCLIDISIMELNLYKYIEVESVNPFKPEFTIVIFIHYKPRIAVAILDL